jgi:hypothetical protein
MFPKDLFSHETLLPFSSSPTTSDDASPLEVTPRYIASTTLNNTQQHRFCAMRVIDIWFNSHRHWETVQQVAWDTVRGWHRDVFDVIAASYPNPVLRETIEKRGNLTPSTCQRTLEAMRIIGTIEPAKQQGPGAGRPAYSWTLTPTVAQYWETLRHFNLKAQLTPEVAAPRTPRKRKGK